LGGGENTSHITQAPSRMKKRNMWTRDDDENSVDCIEDFRVHAWLMHSVDCIEGFRVHAWLMHSMDYIEGFRVHAWLMHSVDCIEGNVKSGAKL
jgi:hypothetical protein